MKDELSNLFDKEMDRTVFLQHVGIGLLALTGVASIISTLNKYTNNNATSQQVSRGFGLGTYGGNGVSRTVSSTERPGSSNTIS